MKRNTYIYALVFIGVVGLIFTIVVFIASDGSNNKKFDNACSVIEDAVFESKELQSVGEPQPGTDAKMYWQLVFSGTSSQGSVQWNHSDVIEEMSYTCAEGVLEVSKASGAKIDNFYETTSGELIFSGVLYIRK